MPTVHANLLRNLAKDLLVAAAAPPVKDTPPSEGSAGVLYPGEVEHRAETERGESGIHIEDATWAKLSALAAALGVPEPAMG